MPTDILEHLSCLSVSLPRLGWSYQVPFNRNIPCFIMAILHQAPRHGLWSCYFSWSNLFHQVNCAVVAIYCPQASNPASNVGRHKILFPWWTAEKLPPTRDDCNVPSLVNLNWFNLPELYRDRIGTRSYWQSDKAGKWHESDSSAVQLHFSSSAVVTLPRFLALRLRVH